MPKRIFTTGQSKTRKPCSEFLHFSRILIEMFNAIFVTEENLEKLLASQTTDERTKKAMVSSFEGDLFQIQGSLCPLSE